VAATTIGLVALGVICTASLACAKDASRWRNSAVCTGSKHIILAAEGTGGITFEYRVIGGEPTVHKARPIQAPEWHRVKVELRECQVRWRVTAVDAMNWTGDIKLVESFCGNLRPQR
jgi:hypothetical protein